MGFRWQFELFSFILTGWRNPFALEMKMSLDETDFRILRLLRSDGRMKMTELAQAIGMSAPSAQERVRRLEAAGAIRHFTVEMDMSAFGFQLEAVVRMKPRPGSLHIVEKMILDQPRFTDCDKVTGDDCFIARLALKNVGELDDLLDPFHDHAETNTAIVKSSPIRNRTPL